VTATDLSAVAVERARNKGIPCTALDIDSQVVPFADGEFDVVVSIRPSSIASFTKGPWTSACACSSQVDGSFSACRISPI